MREEALNGTSLKTALVFERLIQRPSAIFFGHADESHNSARVADLLRRYFDVRFYQQFTFEEQDTFEQDEFAQYEADFLFNFGPLIVRKPLLDSIKIAAINFHPAPPRWPGRGSCAMALLNGDTEFGVTAHLMNSKFDDGAILQVIQFPIFENDVASSLESRAYSYVPHLVRQLLVDLSQNNWQPRPC